LEVEVLKHVRAAYPCEAVGWFCRKSGDLVHSLPLPAAATPYRFTADVHPLIEYAYGLESEGIEVIGTFHSHPKGGPSFSAADDTLALWGEWHALCVRSTDGNWSIRWGRRHRT
jgi:proteasome lid subunit RPN8/RPN11